MLTPWQTYKFVQVTINGKTECRIHSNFVRTKNLYIPTFKQRNKEKLIYFKVKVQFKSNERHKKTQRFRDEKNKNIGCKKMTT